MKAVLITLAGALIIAAGVACGSAEEDSAPVAQVADLSDFPTPTRSQAEPRPTAPPTPAQPQPSQDEVETAEVEPMTPEEFQQLRQRMQSGELSEEEMQQAIDRLRAQFGGGQGGPPFGGNTGSVAVGSIESVGNSAIIVKTELASVTVSVGEDTDIRITSILEPEALTEGAQVMVVSERVEGRAIARVVTILPEGQDGFGGGPGGQRGFGGQGGQGGFGGGQGGLGGGQGEIGARPLFGTLGNVTDDGFTLDAQQGPLPVALDDELLVVRTWQGTIDDLEVEMQVRVIGADDDSGGMEARSVVVTPEGMEDVRGFGGGARGLGGRN